MCGSFLNYSHNGAFTRVSESRGRIRIQIGLVFLMWDGLLALCGEFRSVGGLIRIFVNGKRCLLGLKS